jgi:hypothetical protein
MTIDFGNGFPACSVPCGTAAGGLPVGMQIVGGGLADALVLALHPASRRDPESAANAVLLLARRRFAAARAVADVRSDVDGSST